MKIEIKFYEAAYSVSKKVFKCSNILIYQKFYFKPRPRKITPQGFQILTKPKST